MGDDDGAAEIGEELGSDGAGGSVRAVDDDLLVVEREAGHGGEQEAHVLGAVGVVDWRGVDVDGCGGVGCELAEDLGFDG